MAAVAWLASSFMGSVSRRIAASRAARVAALPGRLRWVGRHDAHVLGDSLRWLVRSREHTNLTYDLTPLNRMHLAWFVAGVAGVPVAEAEGYLDELDEDSNLRGHVQAVTAASPRARLADPEVRYGRRLGWYALVRATKPGMVVETGTDKGLGSCVLAAALLRNGSGRLVTFDVNPDSGYLIDGKYAEVVERRIEDARLGLAAVGSVDLFIHDSLHTREHEDAEIRAVAVAEGGMVLTDNAHVTDALPCWAAETGRQFAYFQERPAGHWYPGGGIGIAY